MLTTPMRSWRRHVCAMAMRRFARINHGVFSPWSCRRVFQRSDSIIRPGDLRDADLILFDNWRRSIKESIAWMRETLGVREIVLSAFASAPRWRRSREPVILFNSRLS